MAKLVFSFMSAISPELIKSRFQLSQCTPSLNTIRGKTAGAFVAFGPFQWTSVVGVPLWFSGIFGNNKMSDPRLGVLSLPLNPAANAMGQLLAV